MILEHDLDMVKMYYHTKNEVSTSTHSKGIARTDRQTHTHTHTDMTKTLPLPHTWEVMKCVPFYPISHIHFRQLMVMDETHVINQMKEDVCYVSSQFYKDMETAR